MTHSVIGPLRRAVRRPQTVAAAASAAFLTLFTSMVVDSATGSGVSLRGAASLSFGAAVLGGISAEALRGQVGPLRSAIRRAVILGFVGFVVLGTVYLIAHRSTFGQRFERDTLLGHNEIGGLEGTAQAILALVTGGSLLLVGGTCCAVAAMRNQMRLAFGLAVAIIVTTATAIVLKSVLLPRPRLLGDDAITTVRSYPSGHVAAAAAIGGALVLVARPKWRMRAAVAAVIVTGLVGISVLVAGWHRPSDAIGSVALAASVFATTAAVMAGLHTSEPGGRFGVGPRVPSRFWLIGIYSLVVGLAGFLVVELTRLDTASNGPQQTTAFLAGCATFVAVECLAFAGLVSVLRGMDATADGSEGSGERP